MSERKSPLWSRRQFDVTVRTLITSGFTDRYENSVLVGNRSICPFALRVGKVHFQKSWERNFALSKIWWIQNWMLVNSENWFFYFLKCGYKLKCLKCCNLNQFKLGSEKCSDPLTPPKMDWLILTRTIYVSALTWCPYWRHLLFIFIYT